MMTLEKINVFTGAKITWKVESPEEIKIGIRSACALRYPMTANEAGDFLDLYSRGKGGITPDSRYKIIIAPKPLIEEVIS